MMSLPLFDAAHKNATLAEIRARQRKWDNRFIELAATVAGWSKDPSTQFGAVIVAPDKSVVSLGYNGFPAGIADTHDRLHDRETKHRLVVHCEMNAVLSAHRSVRDCTLYLYPFLSCERCAVHMIQAGIKRVVARKVPKTHIERWGEAIERSKEIFAEAGVEVVEL